MLRHLVSHGSASLWASNERSWSRPGQDVVSLSGDHMIISYRPSGRVFMVRVNCATSQSTTGTECSGAEPSGNPPPRHTLAHSLTHTHTQTHTHTVTQPLVMCARVSVCVSYSNKSTANVCVCVCMYTRTLVHCDNSLSQYTRTLVTHRQYPKATHQHRNPKKIRNPKSEVNSKFQRDNYGRSRAHPTR